MKATDGKQTPASTPDPAPRPVRVQAGIGSIESLHAGGAAVTDCSADPYDVRPALGAILDRVARARLVRHPVVVLMGEWHASPIIRVLFIALSRRLAEQHPGDVACGLEYPHNGLGAIMAEAGFTVDYNSYVRLRDADRGGQTGLLMALAALGVDDAPLAFDTMLNHLRISGLSTQFNDAAWIGNPPVMDPRDEATRTLIEQGLGVSALSGPPVACRSVAGTALRNFAMVNHALRHIAATNAGVYIQSCGASHVFGSADSNLRYHQSLCALFRRAGADVIPVYQIARPDDLHCLPAEALGHDGYQNSVIITGASAQEFRTGGAQEEDFLKTVGTRSGITLPFFKKFTPAHTALLAQAKTEGLAILSRIGP